MSNVKRDGLKTRDKAWWLIGSDYETTDHNYVIRMAWPVYAWRCLVPKLVTDDIDPIMLAVLRLARAGVVGVHDIGRLLDLRDTTIDQAVWQCVSLGMLGKDGITLLGTNMVDKNEPPDIFQDEVQTGWIFRDALSGDILPIFHVGNLRPGKHSRPSDYILPYDNLFSQSPSTRDIVTALKQQPYESDRHSNKTQEGSMITPLPQADSSDITKKGEIRELNLQNIMSSPPTLVKVLTNEPEMVDIIVCFYVNEIDPSQWHVWSSFTDDVGLFFKKSLAWGISTYQPLKTSVEGWMSSANELFPPLNDESEAVYDALPILRHCDALESVANDLKKAHRAERISETDPDPDVTTRAFLAYSRALEGMLVACIETIPLTVRQQFIDELPIRDFKQATERRAEELDIAFPKHYCRDDMGLAIRNPAIHGGTVLRPQTVFLFTYAYFNPDSPLLGVLQENPNLFKEIDVVSKLRNEFSGAHYSRDGESADVTNELMTMRETTYGLLRVLSNHYLSDGSISFDTMTFDTNSDNIHKQGDN